MKQILLLISLIVVSTLRGGDIPKPTEYVNDGVGMLSPQAARSINSRLADFWRSSKESFADFILRAAAFYKAISVSQPSNVRS